MTAKESLRDFVDELSEGDAVHWLKMTEDNLVERVVGEDGHLPSEELLMLPRNLQRLILRLQASYYTPADAETDLAAWAEWQEGTGADIDLVDG